MRPNVWRHPTITTICCACSISHSTKCVWGYIWPLPCATLCVEVLQSSGLPPCWVRARALQSACVTPLPWVHLSLSARIGLLPNFRWWRVQDPRATTSVHLPRTFRLYWETLSLTQLLAVIDLGSCWAPWLIRQGFQFTWFNQLTKLPPVTPYKAYTYSHKWGVLDLPHELQSRKGVMGLTNRKYDQLIAEL